MKAYGGLNAYIHDILTPVYVAEWSASDLDRFIPGEIVPILN
jgi:hypothetical protein